jgi:hypothetical protein
MRNDNSVLDDWTAASTVETEAFVNVGRVDDTALDFVVTPRHGMVGIDSNMATTQACVTITACEIPDEDDKRAPVDIVVALDVSTSMYGKKLELCKRTLEMLLRVLSSKDQFALISYGSKATVEIPARKMTNENKEMALKRIKEISCNGCTNLSGGLTLAAQEMRSIQSPNQVRSIFLLTDGHANEGVTDGPGLVSIVKSFSTCSLPVGQFNECSLDETQKDEKPKSIDIAAPIPIHCFGYGSDHDSKILQMIADATLGGTYYFVDSDSNVKSAFGDAMGGVLSVVAQSAVVTISVPLTAAALGVEIVNVHHKDKIQRDNGSYTITVGDFYAEETRDVLFDIRLARGEPGVNPIPHAMIQLSYTDTIYKTACTAGPILCSIARPKGSEVSESNPQVEAQWLRIFAAGEMEAADAEAQNNNLQAAIDRLNNTMSMIAGTAPAVRSTPLVMALQTDIRCVQSNFSSTAKYRSVGQHAIRQKGAYMMKQRCTESTPESSNAYRVSKKTKMATFFKKG